MQKIKEGPPSATPNNFWFILYKAWSHVWAIIGGIGVLITIVTGVIVVRDRYSPSTEPLRIREYIFASQYYYVQALVNDANKVIAYGVTTRDKNFNPTFTILEGLYFADKEDPENLEKATSGAKKIQLGVTRFKEIGLPDNIFSHMGAHDYYYHEEYYFGYPGLYQTYFFADNESGYSGEEHVHVPLPNKKNFDAEDPEAAESRQNIINTFYVTAPNEGFDNVMLRRYLVGPDYYQVRVIPEAAITDELDIEEHLRKVARLSTEVNIEKFTEVLGKPLIVNESPTFNIRDDLTEKQRYELEHPPSPSLTSQICGLISFRTLFSKVSLVCAQLKLKALFGEEI